MTLMRPTLSFQRLTGRLLEGLGSISPPSQRTPGSGRMALLHTVIKRTDTWKVRNQSGKFIGCIVNIQRHA